MSRVMPKGKRFRILARDNFRCRYCGAESTTTQLQIDHVVPVQCGGTDADDNLVTACEACNMGKGGLRIRDLLSTDLHARSIAALKEIRQIVDNFRNAAMREVLEVGWVDKNFNGDAHPYELNEFLCRDDSECCNPPTGRPIHPTAITTIDEINALFNER